jgi:hypothetical protein
MKWAARLHEIGLDVSHGGYHRHGAYLLENADREAQLERARRLRELDLRQRGGAAPAMQQHREPQQHDEVEGAAVPGWHELLEPLERELAAVIATAGLRLRVFSARS